MRGMRDPSYGVLKQCVDFLFWDSVSLHSPGCLRTHYVVQADLELIEICLPLMLSAWITGVYHYTQHINYFLNFLIQYIPSEVSPPFSPHTAPPNFSFPPSTPFSVSLQKREGLPGISTKCAITRDSKTRHKSSYQDLARQPNRRQSAPRVSKRIRHTTTPTGRALTRIQSYTTITYM